MDYYAQHRYHDFGTNFRDHFVPEQRRRSQFWGRRPFVQWPRHGSMPHDYIDEYGSRLPHRQRCGFSDISTQNIWPRATSEYGSTAYPDSVEELWDPERIRSDSAESPPDRGRRRSANKHRAKTQEPQPDYLPPLNERCETLQSGSSPTSPSSQSQSGRQPPSVFSSFSTYPFPSVSNSDPSTASRPGSSSPPISPRTNDPSFRGSRESDHNECRRLRHERRLNQRARRRLMKNLRVVRKGLKELQFREKLVREREMELGIKAEEYPKGLDDNVGNFDTEGYDSVDGWWNIPGILD